MDELLGIGEFSKRCGLSPKMLRTYAAKGLLTPAAVDGTSGYRYYSPGQVEEAQVIRLLRQAGVPLTEIATFLRQPTRAWVQAWDRRLVEQLHRQRKALAEVAEMLVLDVAPVSHQPRRVGAGGASMITLNATAASDIGPVRPTNQDVALADQAVMAVADGMGGHRGGEVAAQAAIDTLRASLPVSTIEDLQAAVLSANRAVWEHARNDPNLEGMGTTICAAGLVEVDGEMQLGVVWVGDSRAYRLHEGGLCQLTQDHTLVADLVRQGELTAQEARHHPQRAVLTRALGVGPEVHPDSVLVAVEDGDRVILCTDGLFNELDDEEISAVAASRVDAQAAADDLVGRAVDAGGHDNVSVVVIDVTAPVSNPVGRRS